MIRRLIPIVLVAFAAACGKDSPATPTQPTAASATTTISPQAQAYLNEMIGLMQSGSINRLTIDWNAFRADVLNAAGAAQTIADTLPAIRVAITRLGDGHSSYRSTAGTVVFVGLRSCAGSGGASQPLLPDTIAYISVGAFSGTSAAAAAFANAVQATIQSRDRDGLLGWIVDLRGNGGGNMWPMIAGLGPVLGEGLLGHFVSPIGSETPWEYRDGASWSAGFLAQRVDAPYRLRRDRPRVAVLTDTGVASSGEATVIAFRQRADTRSFGEPTCGLSTANSTYTLSDGATLNLTTAVMADRTKARYGDAVAPDEIMRDRNQLVSRVIAWIQTGS